jgi:hypothetical protein
LAELLCFSSLGAIIGAANEVARRLDLVSTLRYLVYDRNVSPALREVDQLHPLVKENVWLFGEAWQFSRSEAGLTSVLRDVVGHEVALEVELVRRGKAVQLPDGKQGRVDLLLQRTMSTPDGPHRLVIELKRPSVHVGNDELSQVRRYANALTEHPGSGSSRWTFWLVASGTKDEIRGDLAQRGRRPGHVTDAEKDDLWVVTWGDLLNEVAQRYGFYKQQLEYQVSQDESVAHVRRRHLELLPPRPPEPQAPKRPQSPTI